MSVQQVETIQSKYFISIDSISIQFYNIKQNIECMFIEGGG